MRISDYLIYVDNSIALHRASEAAESSMGVAKPDRKTDMLVSQQISKQPASTAISSKSEASARERPATIIV